MGRYGPASAERRACWMAASSALGVEELLYSTRNNRSLPSHLMMSTKSGRDPPKFSDRKGSWGRCKDISRGRSVISSSSIGTSCSLGGVELLSRFVLLVSDKPAGLSTNFLNMVVFLNKKIPHIKKICNRAALRLRRLPQRFLQCAGGAVLHIRDPSARGARQLKETSAKEENHAPRGPAAPLTVD